VSGRRPNVAPSPHAEPQSSLTAPAALARAMAWTTSFWVCLTRRSMKQRRKPFSGRRPTPSLDPLVYAAAATSYALCHGQARRSGAECVPSRRAAVCGVCTALAVPRPSAMHRVLCVLSVHEAPHCPSVLGYDRRSPSNSVAQLAGYALRDPRPLRLGTPAMDLMQQPREQ
jgi:hypothetical protein